MIRTIWSEASRDDLRRIDRRLAADADAEVAGRTLLTSQGRVHALAGLPRRGPVVIESGTRALRIAGTPCVALYDVGDRSVDVVRIRHRREDWRG